MAAIKGKQSENGTEKKIKQILLLPILFFVTFYLFGIRARIVPTYVSDQFWYAGGSMTGDLYGYFRMQLLAWITGVFLLILVAFLLTGNIKLQKHKVYLPIGIYILMVLLSYACSAHKEIALFGYLSRYEGTVTLLCYMGLIFYTMHCMGTEQAVKITVRCFSVACLILGIWGFLQTRGVRMNMLPAWLYIPQELLDKATMTQKMQTNAVNWFFSNQNYSSFFMIFPIGIFAMATISAESKKGKLFFAALTGLMLFNLWQSSSLGGMVGLAAAVVAGFLLAGKENLKKWRRSIALLALAAVISVGFSLPVILKEIQSGSALGKILNIEVAYATKNTEEKPLQRERIDAILTDGADIYFSFAGEEVWIKTANNHVKEIIASEAAKQFFRVSEYVEPTSNYPIVKVETKNCTWNFVIVNGQTYFVAPTGKTTSLKQVERMGFENSEDFATYRGYIWSRTLPLLKETILIGKGADTFALYFPQHDYAGKYNINYFSDTKNTIIDKPHNMYLGVAVNTGWVSLFALLTIYAFYLWESIKTYRKREYNTFIEYIGLGIFAAVIGFLVSALVNDGTVQMMPLVYIFLGMGFAINRMVQNREK